MNEKNSQFIEQVNAIKLKLNKYSNLKSYDKVNEYLHNLSRFHLNDEIITRTEIMNCLKDLKNKENPAFSSKANDLIKKFKNDALTKPSSKSDTNKSMPNKATTKSSENKPANTKPNDSNKPKQVATQSTNQIKKEATNSSTIISKKTTADTTKTNVVKKRPSTANEKPKNIVELENASKKAKLSFSDYKLLKGSNAETRSESSNDNRGSTSSSSSQYEIETDINSLDTYSPTPKNILSDSKPNSRLGSSLNDKQKIIVPPIPSTPLDNILITKVEAYEPYSVSNPSNSLTTNFGGMKNSISKYTSSLKNATSKIDNDDSMDDVLAKIMREKGQKKQILYTGKRNVGQTNQVSKLYDMSIKVLTDTLDDLPNRISIYNTTHDFPIAFDLIKPVLERANARQLENCENYSPNLLSETDYIWRKVCEREFRQLSTPDEDESWRDLYYKKIDEREEEFQRARRLISSKQQAKPKERQTQLATIKPSVASRSARNNTSASSSIRMISHDGGNFKKASNAGSSGSRFPPPPPAMSQGRKAIMKLINKVKRR